MKRLTIIAFIIIILVSLIAYAESNETCWEEGCCPFDKRATIVSHVQKNVVVSRISGLIEKIVLAANSIGSNASFILVPVFHVLSPNNTTYYIVPFTMNEDIPVHDLVFLNDTFSVKFLYSNNYLYNVSDVVYAFNDVANSYSDLLSQHVIDIYTLYRITLGCVLYPCSNNLYAYWDIIGGFHGSPLYGLRPYNIEGTLWGRSIVKPYGYIGGSLRLVYNLTSNGYYRVRLKGDLYGYFTFSLPVREPLHTEFPARTAGVLADFFTGIQSGDFELVIPLTVASSYSGYQYIVLKLKGAGALIVQPWPNQLMGSEFFDMFLAVYFPRKKIDIDLGLYKPGDTITVYPSLSSLVRKKYYVVQDPSRLVRLSGRIVSEDWVNLTSMNGDLYWCRANGSSTRVAVQVDVKLYVIGSRLSLKLPDYSVSTIGKGNVSFPETYCSGSSCSFVFQRFEYIDIYAKYPVDALIKCGGYNYMLSELNGYKRILLPFNSTCKISFLVHGTNFTVNATSINTPKQPFIVHGIVMVLPNNTSAGLNYLVAVGSNVNVSVFIFNNSYSCMACNFSLPDFPSTLIVGDGFSNASLSFSQGEHLFTVVSSGFPITTFSDALMFFYVSALVVLFLGAIISWATSVSRAAFLGFLMDFLLNRGLVLIGLLFLVIYGLPALANVFASLLGYHYVFEGAGDALSMSYNAWARVSDSIDNVIGLVVDYFDGLVTALSSYYAVLFSMVSMSYINIPLPEVLGFISHGIRVLGMVWMDAFSVIVLVALSVLAHSIVYFITFVFFFSMGGLVFSTLIGREEGRDVFLLLFLLSIGLPWVSLFIAGFVEKYTFAFLVPKSVATTVALYSGIAGVEGLVDAYFRWLLLAHVLVALPIVLPVIVLGYYLFRAFIVLLEYI